MGTSGMRKLAEEGMFLDSKILTPDWSGIYKSFNSYQTIQRCSIRGNILYLFVRVNCIAVGFRSLFTVLNDNRKGPKVSLADHGKSEKLH